MKSILLFLMSLVLNISVQAQVVSKDSVSFNTEFTKTTLFLEFNQALSQDTVYTTGLPFTFVFMAPKDSISIQSVTKNEANTTYTIEFNTRPNTYYSLLSLDVKTKPVSEYENYFEWASFSTHFTTGPNAAVDSIRITEQGSIILKNSLNISDLWNQSIFTAVLIKPSSFLNFIEKKADLQDLLNYNAHYNMADTALQNGIISLSSFHFSDKSMNSEGYDVLNHRIKQTIYSTYTDSVVLFTFFTGRNYDNPENLNIPFCNVKYQNNSKDSVYFSLSHYESFDSSQFIKSFKWWDTVNLYTFPIVSLSVVEKALPLKPTFLSLESAYPNPFNPSTSVSFSVSEPSRISFSVFDVLGRKVKELSSSESLFSSGKHQFSFDFSSLASGVYVIEASGISLSSNVRTTQTIKVTLAK